jgi:hypothetical protein
VIFPISAPALNQLRRDYKLFEHNGRACFQCRKCAILFVLAPSSLTPGNFEGLSLHAAGCAGELAPGVLPARVKPFGS